MCSIGASFNSEFWGFEVDFQPGDNKYYAQIRDENFLKEIENSFFVYQGWYVANRTRANLKCKAW